MTWHEYGTDLDEKLADLHGRIHRGTYRAQPARRACIAKGAGRQRPLGIAALEDKIVQHAVVTVLNQIYEEDFVGFSYGFRPGRSQHQALDALWVSDGCRGRLRVCASAVVGMKFAEITSGTSLTRHLY